MPGHTSTRGEPSAQREKIRLRRFPPSIIAAQVPPIDHTLTLVRGTCRRATAEANKVTGERPARGDSTEPLRDTLVEQREESYVCV